MTQSVRRRVLFIALPAFAVSILFALAAVEAWVRITWDDTRGTPGLFLSDAVKGQRLAPDYDGWFAGVPVHINSLGFRDPREYALQKAPNTFRILVLGDSVTFGHGAVFEATYPYLLEQRLDAWKPDIDWQVWNLGVPGYNTANELALLLEKGPVYQPDLVVVGFYENDFTDNTLPSAPSLPAQARSAAQRFLQRHVYSFELYKRVFLTLAWRLGENDFDRQRLEHMTTEDALLARQQDPSDRDHQQIGQVEYFDDAAVKAFQCVGIGDQPGSPLTAWQQSSGWDEWLATTREFQRLHREGTYRVVFFANTVPPACPDSDRFYQGGDTLRFSDDLTKILGDGTPAVSTARAFLHYRPSQMPRAAGHSIGNANRVKADVLFEFLRDHVLRSLL